MVNRVILVGRLVRDPEPKTTQTGKSVCDFSIAVDKRFKPQDGSASADFFRITAWGATADFVGKYLTKGRLVAVDGRLQQRRYTASDGQQREVYEVVAESVQGLDRPRDDDGGGSDQENTASREASTAAGEYDPFEAGD